jgi:hypothetical protein
MIAYQHGPVGDCWMHGMHYHCPLCEEITSYMGHLIPESEFENPKFTCQEESDESVL